MSRTQMDGRHSREPWWKAWAVWRCLFFMLYEDFLTDFEKEGNSEIFSGRAKESKKSSRSFGYRRVAAEKWPSPGGRQKHGWPDTIAVGQQRRQRNLMNRKCVLVFFYAPPRFFPWCFLFSYVSRFFSVFLGLSMFCLSEVLGNAWKLREINSGCKKSRY